MEDERLIVAVRSRAFVYNKADKNHSNRDLIQKAWENIAEEMGNEATAVACKTRWTSLRDYFLRKHKEMKQSTSGQGATKKKKWHLYDFMQFLLPRGASSSNLPDDEESNASQSDDEAEHSQATPASPASFQSEESALSAVSNTQQRRKRKATTPSASDIDLEFLKAFKTPQEPQAVDENENKFRSLLPSLKTLDRLQTMHFRMDVQRLLLSYMEKASSRTTTNTPSPASFPHQSLSGRSSLQLGQVSSDPYQRPGTPQSSASYVQHGNASSFGQSFFGDDTYSIQGSQY